MGYCCLGWRRPGWKGKERMREKLFRDQDDLPLPSMALGWSLLSTAMTSVVTAQASRAMGHWATMAVQKPRSQEEHMQTSKLPVAIPPQPPPAPGRGSCSPVLYRASQAERPMGQRPCRASPPCVSALAICAPAWVPFCNLYGQRQLLSAR